MRHDRIRFETFAPPVVPDPARMDVACFVGLIQERAGADLPRALRDGLILRFGASEEALAHAGERLLNRPVPVTSTEDFEALFDPVRLESQARVESNALAETLPGSGIAPELHVVLDGEIHVLDLAPLPTSPDELLAAVQAAGLAITARLSGEVGARRLVLERPLSAGAGTLAVLTNVAYGFPATRRSVARTITCPMGQAALQFFAMGGRKAVILRMGDPLPYTATAEDRNAALWRLMVDGDLTPGTAVGTAALALGLGQAVAPPVTDVQDRWGAAHLHDLNDVTFLLFPDLPELCALPPERVVALPEPEAPEEVFAECLPPIQTLDDAEAAGFAAPQVGAVGAGIWRAAVERHLDLLQLHLRDKLMLAALPRFTDEVRLEETIPQSAFLQVAGPWLRTPFSRLAPGGIMAPDAALAGHLATQALLRGTFLSTAPVPVPLVHDAEAAVEPDLPLCWFGRDPRGMTLSADLTTSADPSWADGPVSRLMAMLLRSARKIGAELVFSENNERLWARVEGAMRTLLEEALRVGALRGKGEGDSYDVRCDETTMSQQDIDTGRLVAEVSFSPAVPVQRITVLLPITERALPAALQGGPQ